MIFPVTAHARNLSCRQFLSGTSNQAHSKRAGRITRTRSKTKRVALALDDVHAPIAFVLECEWAVCLNAQTASVQWIQWAAGVTSHFATRNLPKLRLVA